MLEFLWSGSCKPQPPVAGEAREGPAPPGVDIVTISKRWGHAKAVELALFFDAKLDVVAIA